MIDLVLARAAMADRLAGQGFPPAVVAAMGSMPRHAFLPAPFWRLAYAETDLWLDVCGVAAPGVVARMLAALAVQPGQRVLEFGTGCGYLTALLASQGAAVFTIEPSGGFDLVAGALDALGTAKIHRSLGGGPTAWLAHAPFDAVVVNPVLPAVPQDLIAQLAPGHGRLVAAIGMAAAPSRLTVLRRMDDGRTRTLDAGLVPPLAVPVTGSSSLGASAPLESMRTEP